LTLAGGIMHTTSCSAMCTCTRPTHTQNGDLSFGVWSIRLPPGSFAVCELFSPPYLRSHTGSPGSSESSLASLLSLRAIMPGVESLMAGDGSEGARAQRTFDALLKACDLQTDNGWRTETAALVQLRVLTRCGVPERNAHYPHLKAVDHSLPVHL
jgi:hypothetical protein